MNYEEHWISDSGEQFIGDMSLTKVAERADRMVRERYRKHCHCHWNKDLCGVHSLTGTLHSVVHSDAVKKVVAYYGGSPEVCDEWSEILS